MAQNRTKLSAVLALVVLLTSGCKFYLRPFSFSFSPKYSRAEKAEQLRNEGKCDEAIEEYRSHMQTRLTEPTRPEDENPYFYYLLIGDCHLQMGDVEQAKKDYVAAKDANVQAPLVNERLRRLGHWYEAQGRFDEAIDHLQEFRELDTLMFDLDIDRIHKRQVRSEQESELNSSQTPNSLELEEKIPSQGSP